MGVLTDMVDAEVLKQAQDYSNGARPEFVPYLLPHILRKIKDKESCQARVMQAGEGMEVEEHVWIELMIGGETYIIDNPTSDALLEQIPTNTPENYIGFLKDCDPEQRKLYEQGIPGVHAKGIERRFRKQVDNQ